MAKYNLFISHSWNHGDAYDRLENLLKARAYFDYRNYSVPKDDPIHTNETDKDLYEAIRNRIQLTQVVVNMAGVYATYSKWINKEIDIAQNAFAVATSILAVEPWGSEKTSLVVKNAAEKIVGWNTESVVDAFQP